MEDLTKREKEVLKYLTLGRNNLEIAQALCVTEHTIKAHMTSIMKKMCVKDRLQAAIKAIREDLI